MRVAPPVKPDNSQRIMLEQWARSRSLPARQVERARIVLLAAEGKSDLEIAAALGVSNTKAARWRKRFLESGLGGLEKDAPRSGRKPAITSSVKDELIRKTIDGKPENATPLEYPFNGRRNGCERGDGPSRVAGARVEAAPDGKLQDQ